MPASTGNLSRLLVLNAGSSSLKFKVFAQNGGLGGLIGGLGGVVEVGWLHHQLARHYDALLVLISVLNYGCLLQRIGDTANSALIAKGPDSKGEARKWQIKTGAADHVSAMESILGFLKVGLSSGLQQSAV
jgi:hypothetical protein